MSDFNVDDILDMQRTLQDRYKAIWAPIEPENGKNQLLWMISEVGEVIDVIKKQGHEAIMANEAVRAHFVEEMADVLMYYGDVMLCFGITADELKDAYTQKFNANMRRW